MERRSFLTALGVAAASVLVSLGLQSRGVTNVKLQPEFIPGAGRTGHLPESEIDKIDTDGFVAACARCGVCLRVCPPEAIKAKDMAYPTLTTMTKEKCPGFDDCGVCLANCPTDALSIAFESINRTSGTEKSNLIEGTTLSAERPV
jgi:ferredoxin